MSGGPLRIKIQTQRGLNENNFSLAWVVDLLLQFGKDGCGLIKLVLTLLAGGLATSYAEYHFSYNLFEYVVEGVVKLITIGKKVAVEAKTLAAKI